jgi:dGTPase
VPEVEAVVAVAADLYAPDLEAAELAAAHDRLLASGSIPTSFDGSRADLAALKDMTSRLIGHLLATVEDATRARHGTGPLTRYRADLVIPSGIRAECAVLKAVAAHFVMSGPERQLVMSDQREVVRELVQAVLAKPHERLDPLYRADFEQAPDDAAALRAVIDQVASWTDARAQLLHRQWA